MAASFMRADAEVFVPEFSGSGADCEFAADVEVVLDALRPAEGAGRKARVAALSAFASLGPGGGDDATTSVGDEGESKASIGHGSGQGADVDAVHKGKEVARPCEAEVLDVREEGDAHVDVAQHFAAGNSVNVNREIFFSGDRYALDADKDGVVEASPVPSPECSTGKPEASLQSLPDVIVITCMGNLGNFTVAPACPCNIVSPHKSDEAVLEEAIAQADSMRKDACLDCRCGKIMVEFYGGASDTCASCQKTFKKSNGYICKLCNFAICHICRWSFDDEADSKGKGKGK